MDKPKRWVKNVIEKCNPIAGFVHILAKVGFVKPQQFLECMYLL